MRERQQDGVDVGRLPSPGGGRDSGWWLSLYPEAAEANGSFRYSTPARPGEGEPDPERAKAEAARRARGKVRRYCAANRLNRLGTLTYRGSGCHDPRGLRGHVGASSGSCALGSAIGRCPTCGPLSGTRATTGCTCTSP